MTISKYIQNIQDLEQRFAQMTDAEYIKFMTDRFGVYEHSKDKDFRTTLSRIQSHFKKGYFNLPIEDSPILLTGRGE